MKKICLLLLLLLWQSLEGQDLTYGKKVTIDSKVLSEERTYWINLPTSYDDPNFGPQKYPVIYLLDGKSNLLPLVGLVNFMSGRESVNYQIPESIVVCIDTSNRMRDLTPNVSNKSPDGTEPENPLPNESGGGEAFFEFLTRELIPTIEADYRTLPYRVYVGHSLGGLTSTYTLLHHAGVFDGYLAIDPSLWWDGAKYVNESPQALENFGTEKIQRYYASVIDLSEAPGQNLHIDSIHQLGRNLAEHAPQNLKWNVHLIPDTDHSSIPLLSWYHGLQFIFDGYDMSHYAMMEDPASIEKHFDELAKNTGLRMDPPETIFEILAHYLTTPNRFPDAEKALLVINMGLEYHPQSPYLYEKLGAAYEMNKETQKALEAYRKALRLNPENEVARERMQQLEK
jgi:predicted alpha/beta superfamily hydrolase